MRHVLRTCCAAAVISLFVALAAARADQLTFSDWKTTTPFDGPRTSHAAALVNNRIYILGGLYSSGNNYTLYNDVQTALLGNDGAIAQGAWAKTTPFVEPRSGMGVAVHNGFIYLVGGFSNKGTRADAQYARLLPDGMLDTWTTSPNQLAIPRSNLALQVFVTTSGTSYLAAIAGVGEVGKDTVHFDTIETAEINGDGSLGQWKLCPFHLKGGRSAPGVVVNKGMLYVVGGWGDLLIEDVFSDVQYAPIRDDGCPDAWHTNAARLNMPLYGHTTALTAIAGGSTVVVLGGNAGQGNYFNNVQFAPLMPTGETARFVFDTHQFAVPRWGQATVQYNNFLYILGGSQRGNGGYLNDVQFTGMGNQ